MTHLFQSCRKWPNSIRVDMVGLAVILALAWVFVCVEPAAAQVAEEPAPKLDDIFPVPQVDPKHQTLGSLIEGEDESPAGMQPTPASNANRLAIPSASVQAKILPLVNEVFELEPKKLSALEPKEMSDLARSILKEAAGSASNPDQQYVMLRKACELAAQVGDLPAALQAIDGIGQRFRANTTAMRIIMTRTALKANIPPQARVSVIEMALPVVDEAIAVDKYDAANKICSSLLTLASRVADRSYTQQVAERRKLISQKQKAFGKVSAALKAIKVNPDDPEANTILGSYLCLNKDEWDKGLVMLAKGSDPKLKQAALQDQANPSDLQKQVQVGDSWYDAAKELPDNVKLPCLERAKSWYERCLTQLSGLQKVKVEKRLENIAEAAKTLPKANSVKPRFPCKGILVAACDYRFDIAINGSIVTSGSYATAVKEEREFKAGDTIIVRVRRTTGKRAFSCAIKLEGFPRMVVTAPGGGWMSYRPASTYYWYRAEGGKVVGPAIPAMGASSQVISKFAGVACPAIWSSSEDSPTSTYSSYAYLILQVK